MGAKETDAIPGKILRMLPGKRLGSNTDQIVATGYKIENIKGLNAAMILLNMLNAAGGYITFVRGGVLNRIREEGWPEEAGMTFEKLVSGLGIRPSKADAQIGLYNNLMESECSQADWELLGWVKLRLIAPFLTAENRAQWIDLADSKSLSELVDHLRTKQPKSSAHIDTLRESIKKAGYVKALRAIEEIWPDLEIKVYEP
jgi:hypothetical protein